jgi:hypothetical protein
MVPEEKRVKRTKAMLAQAPAGTSFCAACQSYRDLEDFAKGATTCRACGSAKAHEAMVAKTYGITGDDYDALLKRQGGKCAICRARPKSKRLAVDHNHATGAVRGLLCSRCNHELMGSAWDSLAIASALWHYMNTPPATGTWVPPEAQPKLAPIEDAARGSVRPSPASGADLPIIARAAGKTPAAGNVASVEPECTRTHYRPVGSVGDPHGPGYWRVYVEQGVELEVAPPF